MISAAQAQRSRGGSQLLVFPDCRDAQHADFRRPRTVVLIHGFTADASYMRKLGNAFIGAGYTAFAYEYACYQGIDYAARALVDLFKQQDARLSVHKTVLVGHSMGGLVARAFVALEGGDRWVRKVITLGTPHAGTLRHAKVLQRFAQLGERLTGLNPRGYGMSSASALQLMQADGQEPLLQRINAATPAVPCLSISGGHANLDFGRGIVKNYFANRWLQKRLSQPNDGLVSESSSDLTCVLVNPAPGPCSHHCHYTDYPNVNHSYLVENQAVAWEAVNFSK